MIHKAFEVIGERVLLNVMRGNKKVSKLGIFQESERFQTTAKGAPRPALDFIEPVYSPNPTIEELAKGIHPRERIHPKNPILSFHYGVDHLKLMYIERKEGAHVFEGELNYAQGTFFNDGNFEVYDRYKEVLKRAGFKTEWY